MKEHWGDTDYQEKRDVIDLEERISKILKTVELDFACFTVDPIGKTLMRIFLHPYGGKSEFTVPEADRLKDHMDFTFHIGKPEVPEDLSTYQRAEYFWVKSVRKETGSIMWKREFTCELLDIRILIMIEQSPKENCTLIPKKREVTYYEMECK